MQELKCRESQPGNEIFGWVQALTPPCTPAFISWPRDQLVPTYPRRWAQRSELGTQP